MDLEAYLFICATYAKKINVDIIQLNIISAAYSESAPVSRLRLRFHSVRTKEEILIRRIAHPDWPI
jgi:hypothetical protein